MWTLVAAAGCAAGLALVLRQFRWVPDAPTRLLLLVLWLRYTLQAFPDTTIQSVFAGFSMNALAAIGSAGLMALALDRPLLRLTPMVPVYAFIVLTVITGVLNSMAVGLVNDIIKWMLSIGILLLTYRSVVLFGLDRTLRAILCTLVAPVLLQYLSIMLDNPKISEADNTVSYIGGYFHEAVYSIILLTFFCIVSLIDWKKNAPAAGLSLLSVYGLIVANYRTAVIAAIPVALVMGASLWLRSVGIRYRPTAMLLLLLGGAALLPIGLAAVPDRFADVFRVIDEFDIVFKEPGEFTADERELFTGRILIWSIYFEAYSNGSFLQHIIGFGPNAWEGRFTLYAHNTFVSTLYEFGLVGLILLLVLFGYNFWIAMNVSDRSLAIRLMATQASFLIWNITGMPLWSIEGRMLYAILLGCTWAAGAAQAYRPAEGEGASLPTSRGGADFGRAGRSSP